MCMRGRDTNVWDLVVSPASGVARFTSTQQQSDLNASFDWMDLDMDDINMLNYLIWKIQIGFQDC